MSIKLMTIVWALDLASTDKLVLLALADNANDDGVCWPSIPAIANKSSLSERAVQNSISRLRDANKLQITERYGRSNMFTVTPAADAPPQHVHPAADAPTPAPRAPRPPHVVHPGGARGAPRIINEPSFESSGEPPAANEDVAIVFRHWREVHGHSRAQLDDKRRTLIRKALKTYSAADLCLSITGYLNSPHHMGQNERQTKYTDIELLLRDAKHIDAGIKFHAEPPRADLSEKTRRIIDQTSKWVPPEMRHAG